MALCFADFEFTCGGNIVRGEVELLSIGLVITDDSAETILDTFYDTVRPIKHPRLTKQCRKLTGLNQATIDASFDAHFVCSRANALLDSYGVERIFVWGNYDTVGLYSTLHIYERSALDILPIERTAEAVYDVQKDVMKRFGTTDIINVKDLSSALDFEPNGSFHNALVDAQALLCIYSHSLTPDKGCERVYDLLNERKQLKLEREKLQRQAVEQRRQEVIKTMTDKEKALYSSLVENGNKRGASLLIKLHAKVEESYKKLPEGCEIVALSYTDSRQHSVLKLIDKNGFNIPENSEITYKSYKYEDKEKMILESFEQRQSSKPARRRKKRIRT